MTRRTILTLALIFWAGFANARAERIEFAVEFVNANGTPHGDGEYQSTGTLVLDGNGLSYELLLVGRFSSAEIRGPGNIRSRGNPGLDLGPAMIAIHPPCLLTCEPDFTFFFGHLSLSGPQINHLLRDLYYISIDNGAVLGIMRRL